LSNILLVRFLFEYWQNFARVEVLFEKYFHYLPLANPENHFCYQCFQKNFQYKGKFLRELVEIWQFGFD
jgi:hypothetical protein